MACQDHDSLQTTNSGPAEAFSHERSFPVAFSRVDGLGRFCALKAEVFGDESIWSVSSVNDAARADEH
jgi:hypothetical protein